MIDNIFPRGSRHRTAAFSGHRTILPPRQGALFTGPAPSKPDYISGIEAKLDRTLQKLVGEGFDRFLCGMAIGFDLMAGLAVCRLIDAGAPVEICALIPYPGQAERFPPGERLAYNRILSLCASSHVVCPDYRRDCFHRRNDMLVEHSSLLVCYYDGSPGGTHYTVKKALREGSRVVNLF